MLTEWVDSPLNGEVDCIEMDERVVVSDERIRRIILEMSGVTSIAEFQSRTKEEQKEIVRIVMQETGIGPRQMSRVSGMTYSVIYRLQK